MVGGEWKVASERGSTQPRAPCQAKEMKAEAEFVCNFKRTFLRGENAGGYLGDRYFWQCGEGVFGSKNSGGAKQQLKNPHDHSEKGEVSVKRERGNSAECGNGRGDRCQGTNSFPGMLKETERGAGP